MEETRSLPGWLVPSATELRDLSCLAMCVVVERLPATREAAGMIAVAGWLHGQLRGPATGRLDSAAMREVALAEFCAAECRVDDDQPPPPLAQVCRLLGVAVATPLDVNAGYARGVWLTLRWALGESPRPPLDLPLRGPDGLVLDEEQIYATLVSRGSPPAEAGRAADVLATDSRRLAALIEDTAGRARA